MILTPPSPSGGQGGKSRVSVSLAQPAQARRLCYEAITAQLRPWQPDRRFHAAVVDVAVVCPPSPLQADSPSPCVAPCGALWADTPVRPAPGRTGSTFHGSTSSEYGGFARHPATWPNSRRPSNRVAEAER